MNETDEQKYDAILIVAFGGPEKREDVIPFLENVTSGRDIPQERLLQVAKHYDLFDGVSPINQQVRDLIAALEIKLQEHGVQLPVYWGNRNWHPLLPDTMRQMTEDGHQRVLALVLAAYSSYSSCRQYLENIEAAQRAVGDNAPTVDKLRVFFNHPGFIDANAARLQEALSRFPAERRDQIQVAYTAHSIPNSMAEPCDYERQLTETARLVSERAGIKAEHWKLVYQSRSGRPSVPWLSPDICDHLTDLKRQGATDVVVVPIGFLSDHIEVLFDLDDEAKRTAGELQLNMVRAATVGTHPTFVAMLRDLIEERLEGHADRSSVGGLPANPDFCAFDCCPVRR